MSSAPAPDASKAAIATHGLKRHFGDVRAVDGVDLDIAQGEIYGFLGPNGAGKSTTVRMLCTLLLPTAGSATVAGFDVAANPTEVRLRIGVALQDASVDPKLTGRETLELQGRYYGLRGATITRRVESLLDLVDIGDAIDRPVSGYSGGMRRRLDLAASLVHDPEVLFLDEPTTGLDPVSRNRVWEEIRRLHRAGKTIFLTTQYLEEADALAGRVGIINEGIIVAQDTPAALKRSIGSDVVVARIEGDAELARRAICELDGVDHVDVRRDEVIASVRDGSATVSPVAVALSGCGVGVSDISLRTPTLDDVFLELTGNRIQEGEK